ncbi:MULTISPECIES: M23 family metallopeptidase [unclassified Oceanispirochaeta]|uniref:M23 family metallopeptidase n=1 Tax=unclassified Oceanispirochaeta TaxID=2635722 RepID=UPI000E08DF3F|nr:MULTISPECIES: M23 family metallopeptidase [unclassified Oceanispirochaeta]MBF9017461.1 M23 family metallopeptidase [Oceanispirochaeta sp. M2]NPD74033.1 M23 family metallopeptidase [Oceanispirochaeta sp. M1]RDG30200.1 M23 family peptidase [Oceanispirochaeta sp. M1]
MAIQLPADIAELCNMQKYRSGFIILILLTAVSFSLSAQPASHTLQQGETLYSLSRKYGVSVSEIMNANSISSPENLSVGSHLIIPGLTSQNTVNNLSKSEYIVQKGDTFYRIAKNHGLSVNELLALNDFSGNKILKPGESIVVAAGTSSANVTVTPVAENEPAAILSANYSENLDWPVEGQKKALTGKLRGVKIEAPESSLVRSIASGSVVWTGPYRGFGQVVLIDVNGFIYLYGGNEDVFVNVGEYVRAGSRIGRLGNSGLATRTVNMYFSVFKDGIPVSVVSAPRG